jgi:hypothetical protein
MDWQEIASQIAQAAVTPAQRVNALALLDAAESCPAPRSISINPRDAGLSMHWADVEIAVFEDRYEAYRFWDGDTQIQHWPHLPEEQIDPALLDSLFAGPVGGCQP